jgi:hypothetical protein
MSVVHFGPMNLVIQWVLEFFSELINVLSRFARTKVILFDHHTRSSPIESHSFEIQTRDGMTLNNLKENPKSRKIVECLIQFSKKLMFLSC